MIRPAVDLKHGLERTHIFFYLAQDDNAIDDAGHGKKIVTKWGELKRILLVSLIVMLRWDFSSCFLVWVGMVRWSLVGLKVLRVPRRFLLKRETR